MALGPALLSKRRSSSAVVPSDIGGFRGQNIQLLQALLGLPGDQSRLGQTFSGGPQQRLEQFFGPLGSPQTDLQRQSAGGISQFLNQPAPEQRALETSLPALQGILGSAPGAGIISALQPQFERNLSLANQQGGRFGSANAIMRSRALEDFNLLGAQAAQQGQQSQLQAAQVLGMLGGQAGQQPFERLLGAAGVGGQQAQQADIGTQRVLQLLQGLLGVGQQATLGLPVVQNPSPFDQFLRLASTASGFIPGGGGGGAAQFSGGGGQGPSMGGK